MKLALATLVTLTSVPLAFASSPKRVSEGAFVLDSSRQYAAELRERHDLTVDHPTREGYEVYGPKGFLKWLDDARIPHLSLEAANKSAKRFGAKYPSFEELTANLQKIHADHPELTELFSIGKSTQGRDLWVMKISDNAAKDESEPEVKYISSMHGDEVTGREILPQLMEEMLDSYGHDQAMTDLIDNTEIFIMPSMNPDGTLLGQRGNADDIDLNRSFPDWTTSDNQNVATGRPIEVQNVMKFQAEHHFVLSANFHGGSQVVNYPYDTLPELFPLDNLVRSISTDYASTVPYLRDSNDFTGGITNGYAWYEVDGGMQDWSYHWYGDLQFTIELSNTKTPDYADIPQFYKDNKAALLGFIKEAHQGAGLLIEQPKLSGTVKVSDSQGKSLGEFPFTGSEFYKVLEPGKYTFEVNAQGHAAKSVEVSVEANRISANGNYTKVSLE